MIIVINSQGKVVAQQNEDLFQGSVKANVIDLVAPFASNVTFYANFELPDGRYIPENLKGYTMTPSIKVVDGLNVWKLPVDFAISKLYGIVTLQLRGEVGNQIICTSTIKIPIQKGVPYDNLDDIEPTQFDILQGMIQDLRALLDTRVEINHSEYQQVEPVNEDTVGEYFIYDSEKDEYKLVYLPESYNANEKYYKAIKEGIVGNNEQGLYLQYRDGEKVVKFKILSDKATINDKKVVLETDLVAENITYDNTYSGLSATNVKEAIDEIKYAVNDISDSQVIDLGTKVFSLSDWMLVNGVYKILFKHELFTDSLVQSLIVTPDQQAINDLNDNDILIYPEIDIEQESENVAVAYIKADKKPRFNINANVKIQGTTVDAKTEGIQANQIVFKPTDKLLSTTVQKAVEEVQTNLDNFQGAYNSEKLKFASLDGNGKVPAAQLPAYVDDVVECYLHNGAMYLTKVDDVYSEVITPVTGKIYVDLNTNKTYRWSGSQYSVISESLALGETADTAYAGNKGAINANNIQTNANNIQAIINGTQVVGNSAKINGVTITQDEDGLLRVGDIVIPQRKLIWETENVNNQTFGVSLVNKDLKPGDVVELEYTLMYARDDGTRYEYNKGSRKRIKITLPTEYSGQLIYYPGYVGESSYLQYESSNDNTIQFYLYSFYLSLIYSSPDSVYFDTNMGDIDGIRKLIFSNGVLSSAEMDNRYSGFILTKIYKIIE